MALSQFKVTSLIRRGHRGGCRGCIPPTRPKEVLTWPLISLQIIAKLFLYCTLLKC